MAITITGGNTNLSTGLIQAVSGIPEASQITISESRYQRDKVISIATNSVSESSTGRVAYGAKPEQGNHGFRSDLAARRLAQQAYQLGGHQNCKKRDKNTGCRMGELPDCGALINHLVAECLL
jgi:hypothetical protein